MRLGGAAVVGQVMAWGRCGAWTVLGQPQLQGAGGGETLVGELAGQFQTDAERAPAGVAATQVGAGLAERE
jgi:hypothetical protein